jgi:hypothetical protein
MERRFHCTATEYQEVSKQAKEENSVAFSLQANYTDRATAVGRKILLPIFADRRVSRSQRGGSSRPFISVF